MSFVRSEANDYLDSHEKIQRYALMSPVELYRSLTADMLSLKGSDVYGGVCSTLCLVSFASVA